MDFPELSIFIAVHVLLGIILAIAALVLRNVYRAVRFRRENDASTESPAEDSIVLFVSSDELVERVNVASLHAILHELRRVLAGLIGKDSLRVTTAYLPERKLFVDVQLLPADPAKQAVIRKMVQQLPILPVDKPVAVSMTLTGESRVYETDFAVPFGWVIEPDRSVDDYLWMLLETRPFLQAEPTDEWLLTIAEFDWLLERDRTNTDAIWGRAFRHEVDGRVEAALCDLTELLKRSPNSATALLKRAQLLIQEGHESLAEADLRRAIELNDRVVRAYIMLAAVCDSDERVDEAVDVLSTGLERIPNDQDLLLCLSHACVRKGEVNRALSHLNLLIFRFPEFGPAYLKRAGILYELGNLDAAGSDLDCACRYMPDSIEAHGIKLRYEMNQGEWEKAEETVHECLERFPDEPELIADLGTIRGRQGKFAESASLLSQSIEKLPRGDSFFYRAIARLELENFDEALADTHEFLEQGGDLKDVWRLQVSILQRQDRLDTALELCDRIVEIFPEDAVAYAVRAQIYSGLGETEEAVTDLERAISIEPDDADLHFDLAVCHRVLEDDVTALQSFEQAIELDSTHVSALVNRGILHGQNENFDLAIRDLQAGNELVPGDARILVELARMYVAVEDCEMADQVLSEVPDYEEHSFDALQVRSEIYIRQGREDHARDILNLIVERKPDEPDGYLLRASGLIRLDDTDAAQSDIDRAIDIEPEEADRFLVIRDLTLIQHLHDRHQYGEAIEKACQFIDEHPDMPSFYRLRAEAYWHDGQYVEAVEDYSRLLEQEPDNVDDLQARGHIYAEMGEFELALRDLEEARKLVSDLPRGSILALIENGRGLALTGLKRWDEAQAAFETSKQICPRNAMAYFNHAMLHYERECLDLATEEFKQALDCRVPTLMPRKRAQATAFVESRSPRQDG